VDIAILETGRPPGDLATHHGGYDAMVRRLLGDGHAYRSFAVYDGKLPATPTDFSAYVITGSSAGVHDDLPWIAPLATFLQNARGVAHLVGICFGHQIMAQAFGGAVAKAERGWGIGLHEYEVLSREPWMDDAASIAVPASHQDQVTALPPGARVIASSGFTPFAALAYDDYPAISFQCHPEFDPAFAIDLINGREAEIGGPTRRQALDSLGRPNDTARLGRWINDFLAPATKRASPATTLVEAAPIR